MHPSAPIQQIAILELQERQAESEGDAGTGVQKGPNPPRGVQGSTAYTNGEKPLPILTARTPCCVRAFQLSAQELEGREAACSGCRGDAAPLNGK
jgi:hypothetical protein